MNDASDTVAEKRRKVVMLRKPWETSTGPRTTRGKWQTSTNATKHGADSLAFALALRYIETMGEALSVGSRGTVRPSKETT